jgi:protein-L-isoaspartate(D-aspartate) O-methyltransferase
MNLELARFNMIEQQIRPWDVLDPDVLALLAAMHREDFVPEAHRAMAFVDTEVPLPEGQSMLAPRVEARLLQEMAVNRQDRVLEVGTGSGFMAALLARCAREVHTMERIGELATMARANLKSARIGNVTVHQADGAKGLLSEGPFDVIALSGSVAEVPRALLDQLRVGGRLTAIVGHEPVMQALLITRTDEHGYRRVALFDTVAPRLVGFPEPSSFTF